MKFTDGYWMVKKQFEIQSPHEVFDYGIHDNTLTMYAPYKKIEQRSDEPNVGMTTIRINSPLRDVIGVHLYHFLETNRFSHFALNDEKPIVSIEKDTGKLDFTSGNLTIKASYKHDFDLSFEAGGKRLTGSREGAQAEIKDNNNNLHYMREQLDILPDELIYGFGERFTPFVKNGQSIDIWNQDAGTGSEQAYKNIPFYITQITSLIRTLTK
ncbi:hypothetical protein ACLJJ6_09270 [Pediococcus siamensis]|uniref:hypothetical protein n=1 Tax=Pediococcus siamensis TaxID=381829 RepID=UPI0039A1984E